MNLLDILLGPTVGKVLDKIIPDPQAKTAAQLELLKLHQAGEFKEIDNQLQRDLGQIDVNKAEAASGNAFAASWRPFIGWICGAGLAYQFLLRPLLAWASGIWSIPVPPDLDMGDLLTLLGGMLGLAGMRTSEKFRGVAR